MSAVDCPADEVAASAGAEDEESGLLQDSEKEKVVDLCDESNDSSSKAASSSTSKPAARHPCRLDRRRDVYMLSYVREEDMRAALSQPRVPILLTVAKSLAAANQNQLDSVERYRHKLRRLTVRASERKQHYEELLKRNSSLSASLNLSFHLIRTDFLKKWIQGDPSTLRLDQQLEDEPREEDVEIVPVSSCAIQQLSFLCEHAAGLSPTAVDSFKVLSPSAMSLLLESSQATVDWDFSSQTYRCENCVDMLLSTRQKQKDQQVFLEELRDILDTAQPPTASQPGDGYWVSKTFISSVKKMQTALSKAISSLPSQAATTLSSQTPSVIASSSSSVATPASKPIDFFMPRTKGQWDGESSLSSCSAWYLDRDYEQVNLSLRCEQHLEEMVLACSPPVSKRALVLSAEGWAQLKELLPRAVPFLERDLPCQICAGRESEEQQDVRRAKDQRALEANQSKPLQQLSKARKVNNSVLNFKTPCFLVDGRWLAYWRAYLGT